VKQELPIDAILPEVLAQLARSAAVVISAAPGAGKTTRVPPALLDAGLAGEKQVVVLEPRRIAARAAAEYVAGESRVQVGGEIGYRVRLEQRGGPRTRLWFVTEGVFSRQIVKDPFLEDVGVVVLDEFHERHLQGDVALAVARELQATVRADLKLVVMSATLETERIAAHLGDCPVVRSQGRAFPVRVEHLEERDLRFLSDRVRKALADLLREPDDGGDVLVFLPGAGEIRRAESAIAEIAAAHDLEISVLHGELPLEAQRRALLRGDKRRVVLATNVAETALTVEGVTAVIDSGLARMARFDARRGINHIDVRPISRAAADQRAGRAGRTAPGRCVRLWPAAEHGGRLAHEAPEILRLDLAGIVLELRAWGLRDARSLGWLDTPPAASFARAEQALVQLGAIDAEGELTAVGRQLLSLSAPPRLARILVEAKRYGWTRDGALLAALAAERDIIAGDPRSGGSRGGGFRTAGASDLLQRAELFEEAERWDFSESVCRRTGIDRRRVRAVAGARRQLLRAAGGHAPESPASDDDLLRCVLVGFADRVARRRAPGSSRAVMVGRTGVVLDESSVVRESEYFVAIELERGGGTHGAEARVRIASAVRKEWLRELFPGAITSAQELVFDPDRGRVVNRRRECFFDLILEEHTSLDVDRLRAGDLLTETLRADPRSLIGFSASVNDLLMRVSFLGSRVPELKMPSAEALLSDAVAAQCAGRTTLAEMRGLDFYSPIIGLLNREQASALRGEAPGEFRLPSGRQVKIDYGGGSPAVEARIQELFGLTATPRLARGRVPLVIRILGPNYRPVQITDDLESFWRTTYPQVRKQLRGRYPKHNWPEDPLTALPTSEVGRRQPR
jgi:ATP-dependent helicase HrpB